jgi:hypothetical protein
VSLPYYSYDVDRSGCSECVPVVDGNPVDVKTFGTVALVVMKY